MPKTEAQKRHEEAILAAAAAAALAAEGRVFSRITQGLKSALSVGYDKATLEKHLGQLLGSIGAAPLPPNPEPEVWTPGETPAESAKATLEARYDGVSTARLPFARESAAADTTARVTGRSLAQIAFSDEHPAYDTRFPAWRFLRVAARHVPRTDWPDRWRNAAESVGWSGVSRTKWIALKSSPIWAALGNPEACGFSDATGSDFPPFAYGSGMGWMSATVKEAKWAGIDIPEVK